MKSLFDLVSLLTSISVAHIDTHQSLKPLLLRQTLVWEETPFLCSENRRHEGNSPEISPSLLWQLTWVLRLTQPWMTTLLTAAWSTCAPASNPWRCKGPALIQLGSSPPRLSLTPKLKSALQPALAHKTLWKVEGWTVSCSGMAIQQRRLCWVSGGGDTLTGRNSPQMRKLFGLHFVRSL